MKIGIKATQIVDGGGRKHLEKLLRYFPRRAGTEIVVYMSPIQEQFDLPSRIDIKYRVFDFPGRGLLARVIWEQFLFGRQLSRDGIDVLFEPGNFGRIFSSVPRVMLIHNIAPFSDQFIENEPPLSRLRLKTLNLMTRLSARKSKGVIHLTNFARNFVADSLKLDRTPQRVIYMGSDKPLSRLSGRKLLNTRFKIEGKLIFSCSHLYRYKNTFELVRAYREFRDCYSKASTLIIAGRLYDRKYAEEIRDYIDYNGLSGHVILTGQLDTPTILSLYSACDLFVFPSELESASLILLEALQMAAPIAAAYSDLCKEVLDEAAVYFDPRNTNSIFESMYKVLTNDGLRGGLKRAARRRAIHFDWRKTAQQTECFLCDIAGESQKFQSANPGLRQHDNIETDCSEETDYENREYLSKREI